jgi:hypothetical protein
MTAGTYGMRLFDQAGLSPPSAPTGGAPGRRPFESARSNSDQEIGGLLYPI